MHFDNTEEWDLYQTGLDYNNKINYHNKTDLHWNFYNSKQWIGIVTNGLSKWTFNICKSAINYFIAFICSQKIKIQYSAENLPDEPEDENDIKIKEFVTLMSNMADMKWEKEKMDHKLRQLLLDGAVTGDYYAYTYWDANKKTGQLEQGDFCTEIVDGVNVMFGNPNNKEVEAQPYILVLRRSMVSELKKRAKENKIEKTLIDSITSDNDNTYQAGGYGKIELDNKGDNGKASSILKFWKEGNTVYWKESTKFCPIVKKVDLGISRYPIAAGNWDTVKNSYRGISAIDGIIDNQISINQLFAMISYWMKFMAFGKTAIDGTIVKEWSNKIGEVITVNGPVGQNVIQQLEAGNFQGAVLNVIDLAIKYTKDFIGANDTLMGQVNPEQASGAAIMAGGKQASIPLGNPSANRDQFVEDLGLIWGEFFLKKYKNRKVSYKDNGKIVTADYNTDGMEQILLQCKVDVGPANHYNEIVAITELRGLLKDGVITPLQYFERMKDKNVITDVQGLIDDIGEAETKKREYEVMAQIIEQFVPPELQQQVMQMIQQASMPQQGGINTLPQ